MKIGDIVERRLNKKRKNPPSGLYASKKAKQVKYLLIFIGPRAKKAKRNNYFEKPFDRVAKKQKKQKSKTWFAVHNLAPND